MSRFGPLASYRVLSALARRMAKGLTFTALLTATVLPAPAFAAQWMDVATVSATMGNNAGRICTGGGGTDLGCPLYAPTLFNNGNILISSTDTNATSIGMTNGAKTWYLNVSGVGNGYGPGVFSLYNGDGNTPFLISGTDVSIRSGGTYGWSADPTWAGSSDTGLARTSAGLVEVNNGTAGTLRDLRLRTLYANTSAFIGSNMVTPSATLHVSGSIRLAADGAQTCDTSRLGAIRYTNGDFSICQNVVNGWESLATTGANSLADRITSNSQAGVIANSTGYISLTTGGVTGTAYFAPNARLVTTEISTTGTISSTGLYVNGKIGINQAPTGSQALQVSGSGIAEKSNNAINLTLEETNAGSAAQMRLTNLLNTFTVGNDSNPNGFYISAPSQTYSIFVRPSGLVGMGTSDPSATLHVSGTGMFTGALTLNTPSFNDALTISRTAFGGIGFNLGGSSANLQVRNSAGSNISTLRGDVTTGNWGLNGNTNPSTTFDISGTLKIANGGESCDTNRLGAIKYTAGAFYICQNTSNGWETLSTSGVNSLDDRITSNSQAGVIANSTGYISLTTGGVTGTVYFAPNGRLVTAEVSTTGTISSSQAYVGSGGLRIGQAANSSDPFYISRANGSMAFRMRINSGNPAQFNMADNSGTTQVQILSTGDSYFNGGNLAIGTTTTSATLHVSGTAIVASWTTIGSTTAPTGLLNIYTDTNNTAGVGHRMQITSPNGSFSALAPSAQASAWSNLTQSGDSVLAYGRSSYGTSGALTIANWGPGSFGIRITAAGRTGISNPNPSTSLDISGTLRMSDGGEACDTNRLGAIRYTNGDFSICQNVSNGWESLATTGTNSLADRITSNSQAGVIANSTGYISLTTGGVTGTVYFDTTGRLVNAAVSTTGRSYFMGVDSWAGVNVQNNNVNFNSGYGNYWGTSTSIVADRNAQYMAFRTSGTEALRIVSTGYVGIGTTDPSTTLHVAVTTGEAARFSSTNGSNIAFKPNNKSIEIADAGGNANFAYINRGLNNAKLILLPETATGAVGIGTASQTAPSATLHVSGTAIVTSWTTLGSNTAPAAVLDVYGVTDTAPMAIFRRSANNTGQYMTILEGSGGHYLRGFSSVSNAKPFIIDATTDSGNTAPSSGSTGLIVASRGKTVLSVDHNGIFLKNTTGGVQSYTPSATLHVSGTVIIADEGVACDTSRLGAIRYVSGSTFQICQNTTAGWEPLSTTTSSSTPSINTGLSGSIVFRDENGYLKANNTFSISSTTGSVGIGAGAPSYVGTNGLFVSGAIYSGGWSGVTNGPVMTISGSLPLLRSYGTGNLDLAFSAGSNTPEAMRIVSTGYVGIGTTTPSATLHVSGTGTTKLYLGNGTNTDALINFNDRNFIGTMNSDLRVQSGAGKNIKFFVNDNDTATTSANLALIIESNKRVGLSLGSGTASTTLDISGSLKLRAETTGGGYDTCDTSRNGAIKYTGGDFYVCRNGSSWESLTSIATGAAALADRISSNSMAGVTANATGYISLTTGGVTGTVYFAPNGQLVTSEISTTGYVSTTGLTNIGDLTVSSGSVKLNSGRNVQWGTSSILGDSNNRYLAFSANNAEAVRIVSTGYVGIGTTAPTDPLSVSGTITAFSYGPNMGNRDLIRILNGAGNGIATMGETNAGYGYLSLRNPSGSAIINLSSSGGANSYINSGANFGINAGITPSATLHVSGTGIIGANMPTFYNVTTPTLAIGQRPLGDGFASIYMSPSSTSTTGFTLLATNTKFGLSTNGNVPLIMNGTSIGIGMSAISDTPSATLHVSGTLGVNTLGISTTALVVYGTSDTVPTAEFHRATNASQYLAFTNTTSANGMYSYSSAANSKNFVLGVTTDASNNTPSIPLNISLNVLGRTVANVASTGLFLKNNASGNVADTPSTTLHLAGSIRIGAETSTTLNTCDTNRTGAIKYESSEFYVCRNGSSWESLTSIASGAAALADRISSNSMAGVTANDTGYISLTTGGVTGTVYFAPNGRLVTTEISTTGRISATTIYSKGTVQIENGYAAFNNGYGLIWSGDNATIYGDGTAKNLTFRTSGTEALRIVSTGYVGIGTTDPGAMLEVSSSSVTNLRMRRTGAQTGRWDFSLPYGDFVVADTSGSARMYIRQSSGMLVGDSIATGGFAPTPSATLHVSGTGIFNSNLTIYTTATTNALDVSRSGQGGFGMGISGGAVQLQIRNGSNTSIAKLNSNYATGNWGLNLGSSPDPSTTFHISGTVRISNGGEACDTDRLGAIKYAGNAFYICQNTSNGWETLSTSGANSLDDRITSNSQAGVIANSTGYISLTTGGVTGTVYFAPNGRLVNTEISTTGIVSTTGLYSNGDIVTTGNLTVNSGNDIRWQSSNNRITGSAANRYLAFTTSASEAMRIVSTGNVGIGTDTPSVTLNVSSSTGSVSFFAGSNNRSIEFSPYNANITMANSTWMHLNRSNSTHLILNAGGGNVGIGTMSLTNPSATLHVSGTLMVDAAGNTNNLTLRNTTNNREIWFTAQTGGGSIDMSSTAFYIGRSNPIPLLINPGSAIGVAINHVTNTSPKAALDISGSLKIANGGEACDANRTGAIKYAGSSFYICQNTSAGWQTLTTASSSIVSTYASLTDIYYDENSLSGPGSNVAPTSNSNIYDNTAFGYDAINSGNNAGNELAAFGTSALFSNTTGVENVAIGSFSLISNTVGSYNTAVGVYSLMRNVSSTRNSAFGNLALYNNTTGSNNVALGSQALLSNTTSSNNTAIGTFAGQNFNGGSSNTLLGYRAGLTLASGSGNLLLGAGSEPFSTTGSWQLNIANAIWGNIGSGSGNNNRIGINVTSPTANLEVSGTVSVTALTVNGQSVTGNMVTTFASLTDVSSSAGAGNIFGPGSLTGATSAVTQSTAFGQGALASASNSGYSNSAFGKAALSLNTTGIQNTAIGAYALTSNTTGYANTAFGVSTLGANTTGYQNTAVGLNTMLLNVDGYGNTAFGIKSLRDNTSGYFNTSVGNNSMLRNTTGYNNTVIGTSALQTNKVGSLNVVIGNNAGSGVINTSIISSSVLLGAYAGQGLTVAQSNTLIGYNAGGAITTGNNNIVIGTNLSPYSNTGDNQLNLGDSIFGDLRGSLASRIGINVTSPTANLEVSGTVSVTTLTVNGQTITGQGASTYASLTDAYYNGNNLAGPGSNLSSANGNNYDNTAFGHGAINSGNSTGNELSAFGTYSLYSNTTGIENIAIGSYALVSNTTGSYNTGVGTYALAKSVSSTRNSAFGNAALTNNTSGINNTAVGALALLYTTVGNYNTALGAYSGQNLTTGDYNTLLGYRAGLTITTGARNILIGQNTSPYSNSGSYQLNIANAIWGNIGSGVSNTNLIGINVTSPTANLEVSGTISATAVYVNGQALGGSGDRITSGSTVVTAISTTGYVSMTTGGSNWGYFGSAASYLPNLNTLLVSSTRVSATNVSATILNLTGVAGGAGVSLTSSGGADNLGNHTATQNLAMSSFSITGLLNVSATGNMSANTFIGSGAGLTNIPASAVTGLNLDRITSGSTVMSAISATGYISLTTGASNWGYFGSAASYLPSLNTLSISATQVSATNVSTTLLNLTGVAGGAGVSLTIGSSADNLGNHTATQALNMGGNAIGGASTITATGTITTQAAVQPGNTDTTCSGSGDYGKMRFDAATKSLYLCRQ